MAKEQDPQDKGDELQFPDASAPGEDLFGSDSFLGEDSGVGGGEPSAEAQVDAEAEEAPEAFFDETAPADQPEHEQKAEAAEAPRESAFLAKLVETDVYTVMLGLTALALLIAVGILLGRWWIDYGLQTSPRQVRGPAPVEAAPLGAYAHANSLGTARSPWLA